MNDMVDTIIIGAGMSGLVLAKHLSDQNLGTVLVLEKSRGVGGRMATRRTLDTKFDHGAQFYRLKNDISEFHQLWSEQKINHHWFSSELGEHWCSIEGMTKLAKWLAKDLKIELDKQVAQLEYHQSLWTLKTENETYTCKRLIVTAPCPQALQLLDKNKIQYPEELKNYQYTKALIGLITLNQELNIGEPGYIEFQSGPFFSISDQKKKGVSDLHAYTFTMSADFSENGFENTNEESLHKIKEAIISQFPQLNSHSFSGLELKKWRYCQSLKTYPELFCSLENELYLVGDTFGGSSLLGAIRSAKALGLFLSSLKIN